MKKLLTKLIHKFSKREELCYWSVVMKDINSNVERLEGSWAYSLSEAVNQITQKLKLGNTWFPIMWSDLSLKEVYDKLEINKLVK